MKNGDYSVLDDALKALEPYGPEYRGGLSNHGPMAVEALCAVAEAKAVMPWVEKYRKSLEPRSSAHDRISADHWRTALGNYSRVADWMAFFANEIQERPWQDVLRHWVPLLAPGLIAAATHGPIRTGHAVRGLAHGESAQRTRELAEGLGIRASEELFE